MRLTVSPRTKVEVNGTFVPEPCEEHTHGWTETSNVIEGMERDSSIGRHWCIDGTDLSLACSVEHTRGYLEDAEKDAARALCHSLRVQ